MRQKHFLWHTAPGFTVIQATNAFRDHGLDALNIYADQLQVRRRKGWSPVRITVTAQRLENK